MADQFQDSNQLDAYVASPVRHDEEKAILNEE